MFDILLVTYWDGIEVFVSEEGQVLCDTWWLSEFLPSEILINYSEVKVQCAVYFGNLAQNIILELGLFLDQEISHSGHTGIHLSYAISHRSLA